MQCFVWFKIDQSQPVDLSLSLRCHMIQSTTVPNNTLRPKWLLHGKNVMVMSRLSPESRLKIGRNQIFNRFSDFAFEFQLRWSNNFRWNQIGRKFWCKIGWITASFDSNIIATVPLPRFEARWNQSLSWRHRIRSNRIKYHQNWDLSWQSCWT